MTKKKFEIEMKVRDYECDAQGIVNNANYLHYMEVTRHEFMESLGISFKECHEQKIDPVVSRADLRYKTPLAGGELFLSSLTVERKGVKMFFRQSVCRKADGAICCEASVEIAILVNGKLSRGDFFDKKMESFL